jgi:hypothetical protein
MAGIRSRLEKLTDGTVKKIVSAAVASEKSKPVQGGPKLLESYNKLWVDILKMKKNYDSIVADCTNKVKALSSADIEDPAFDEAQRAIAASRKPLAEMNAALTEFEKTGEAIKKLYGIKT